MRSDCKIFWMPLREQHPQVPWKQIEGMRHVMVHDYFKVDWNIVFATAQRDIPALKPEIEAILRSLPEGRP